MAERYAYTAGDLIAGKVRCCEECGYVHHPNDPCFEEEDPNAAD